MHQSHYQAATKAANAGGNDMQVDLARELQAGLREMSHAVREAIQWLGHENPVAHALIDAHESCWEALEAA